jgi:iron(III) transport system ATP-binding protein
VPSTTIDIREITKSYPAIGGPGLTTAVDRVSLTIEAGELFFLLGPSGCGKTTLLRMIAGFIEPTSGSILFNGRDVTWLAAEKRHTGMVFQSYALWPHMTVAQNVAFGLQVRGIKGDERDRRVREALESVRMGEYASRRPTQLSGGQQQRVALARALVIRPDVLLLDEPLSNLDARLRLDLRSEIRRVCKESGITTVYVTHDQKEALSMADRVAVMRAGKVEQIGTPESIYRKPESAFVAEFLGETNLLRGSLERTSGGIRVRLPYGNLSCHDDESVPDGSSVLACVRPESVAVDSPLDPFTTLPVVDHVYLGETGQIVIDAGGGQRLRATVFNPKRSFRRGEMVKLAVDPSDVVVLRDDGQTT